MTRFFVSINFLLPILFLYSNCSHSGLRVQTLNRDQSVKLVMKDGTVDNGIVVKREAENIHYVSETTHQEKIVPIVDIVRVEKLGIIYDYKAHEISEAEINKNKGSGNTWGYALGGAVIGAATGIAIGLPLWYADIDQIPPYFIAGAGAVAGSIFFAFKGQDKDKELAIKKIRYSRMTDQEIQKQIEEEQKRIEELKQQKQKLQEKIKSTP